MYKHILLLFIVSSFTINLYACDVCGSNSIGNSNFYNLANQKIIGVNYSYGSSIYNDVLFSNFDYKSYKQVLTLNALWKIKNSLQLELNLPYEHNRRKYLNKNEQLNSFGDVQFGINHYFNFGKDSSYILKTTFLSETSFSNFSDNVNSMGLQSTSRSIDGIFAIVISKKWQKLGVFINNRHKRNIIEYTNYRFGDILLSEISMNYTIDINKIVIIPIFGILREYKNLFLYHL